MAGHGGAARERQCWAPGAAQAIGSGGRPREPQGSKRLAPGHPRAPPGYGAPWERRPASGNTGTGGSAIGSGFRVGEQPIAGAASDDAIRVDAPTIPRSREDALLREELAFFATPAKLGAVERANAL
jgi:hypothetical protein